MLILNFQKNDIFLAGREINLELGTSVVSNSSTELEPVLLAFFGFLQRLREARTSLGCVECGVECASGGLPGEKPEGFQNICGPQTGPFLSRWLIAQVPALEIFPFGI